jgi:hypothetical protein
MNQQKQIATTTPEPEVILFLHGKESGPGGKKPTYLIQHGVEVINPALPADDFEAAVRIAQAAVDEHLPDVIVGSSRGGAVAMNINRRKAGLVLLCPAWKKWGTASTIPWKSVILHAKDDTVIPFTDSEELIRNSKIQPHRLVSVGVDHQLGTPEALCAMLGAVCMWSGHKLAPNPTISEADIRFSDLARKELERTDLTAERRNDLREALGDIGGKYRTDLDDLC